MLLDLSLLSELLPYSITMPNFYPWPRQHPLTPPEAELFHRGGCAQHQTQHSGQGKMHESGDGFAPSYVLAAAPTMYQATMNYTHMLPPAPPDLSISTCFASATAPSLPPINVPDLIVEKQSSFRRERQEEQSGNQPAKTEKAVGGVCAELDYDLDQMTDFVAEMAQSIVVRASPVHPDFRKFVSNLLTSTRLPSSTVLAGLNYLARRMSMVNTPQPYKASDGQVWRMLTVSLMLGSKFFDDNTFQNRSWAEVTGIPVKELNTLEYQWLEAIDWKLHVNTEKSEDFVRWFVSWENWRAEKKRLATRVASAPPAMIDTNVQRRRSQVNTFSPAQPIANWAHNYQQERRQSYPILQAYNRAYLQHVSPIQMSPPSAPHSGPTTPDCRLLGAGLPTIADRFPAARYTQRQPPASSQASRQMPSVPYHLPLNTKNNNYYYSQHLWSVHHPGCICGCNSRYKDPYSMAPKHMPQLVAG